MVNYQRVLSNNDLFFAGTGYIIGAGIFVLIGEAAKYAGKYTYISTLLAGLLIYYIAQSYIKINKKYDSNDAEYKVINEAFSKITAKTIIIITIIGLICGTYLVSKSCAAYTSKIANIKKNLLTYAILTIICCVNLIGIKSVSILNTLTLGIGVVGLFSIIGIGIKSISEDNNDKYDKLLKYIKLDKDYNNSEKSENSDKSDTKFNIIKNVLFGSYIIIFSYFGFELLIKLNKESINPQKDIPSAMNKSIIFTGLIYTVIAFIYGYYRFNKKLADSDIPLSSLIRTLNNSSILQKIVDVAGIMLTFNTALLSLTNVSRLIDTQLNDISTDHIPTKYIILVTIITFIMNSLDISINKSAIVANGCILTLLISVVIAQKIIIK